MISSTNHPQCFLIVPFISLCFVYTTVIPADLLFDLLCVIYQGGFWTVGQDNFYFQSLSLTLQHVIGAKHYHCQCVNV